MVMLACNFKDKPHYSVNGAPLAGSPDPCRRSAYREEHLNYCSPRGLWPKNLL